MNHDEQWMQRALELAEYGRGNVSPNPMVGCVIVHENRIIGEGWHRQYGGPHAEVWAIADAENRGHSDLLPFSTVYVTLEPCSHTGKTPPCADMLVRKEVGKVVICNVDPNPLVSGRGIEKLRNAGIEVECNVLKNQGLELNKRFFTNISKKRPYVILKWAETADGFISAANGEQIAISGAFSNIRVHQWRSEEDAIMVGYKTALNDNPNLNIRHWKGWNPVRIVTDRNLQLPGTLHLFDQNQPTIVVNYQKESSPPLAPERYSDLAETSYLKVYAGNVEIEEMLNQLSRRGIHSVLVEGGADLLQSFLDAGLWDEIRRCQSKTITQAGVKAPRFVGNFASSESVGPDLWTFYTND